MSDTQQGQAQHPQGQGRRMSIGAGIRSGIGVLTAFKEAIEETIQEANSRGDLSPDRAKQFLGDALHRAQDAVGEVRDRLEWVPRRDFDALQVEVAELRRRLDALEGRPSSEAAVPLLRASPSAPAALPPGPEGPTEARMP
jgi:polyhydroxyalkanoate synthesis regulator phasin